MIKLEIYKNCTDIKIMTYIFLDIFLGDVSKGELGFAAIPGKEEQFKNSIEMTIDYAKALNCKKSVNF